MGDHMNKTKLNRGFMICFILMVAVGSLLFIPEKGALTIWINERRTDFGDWFFVLITNLGYGWAFVVACTFLMMIRLRFAAMMAVSGVLTAIFSAFLKNVVFPDAPRPPKFFMGVHDLHFIDGVKILNEHSFPSGHAMAAFAVFGMLAFITRKNIWGILFFLIACLVGLSRIYLLKHFYDDVYAGAIIGSVISILVYRIVSPVTAGWMDKSVLWLRNT